MVDFEDKFGKSFRFGKSSEKRLPFVAESIDMEYSFTYAFNMALAAVLCTFLASVLYVLLADNRRMFWKLVDQITEVMRPLISKTFEKFRTINKCEEVHPEYEEMEEEQEKVQTEEAPNATDEEVFHDTNDNEENMPGKSEQVTQTQEVLIAEHCEISEPIPTNSNSNENVSYQEEDLEISNNSTAENCNEYYRSKVQKTRGQWSYHNSLAHNSRQQCSTVDLEGYNKNRSYSNIPKWGGKNPQEREKHGGIFKQPRRLREQRMNEYQNAESPINCQYGTPWTVESAQSFAETSYYEGMNMNEVKSVEMQNPNL